jgi:hypothetical protein
MAVFGILIGWVGQSGVSLLFAALLIYLGKLFFNYFEFWFLFRWLYWAGLFYLSVSPSYRTLRATAGTVPEDERAFYRYTLSLTCLMSAVGFIAMAFAALGLAEAVRLVLGR